MVCLLPYVRGLVYCYHTRDPVWFQVWCIRYHIHVLIWWVSHQPPFSVSDTIRSDSDLVYPLPYSPRALPMDMSPTVIWCIRYRSSLVYPLLYLRSGLVGMSPTVVWCVRYRSGSAYPLPYVRSGWWALH